MKMKSRLISGGVAVALVVMVGAAGAAISAQDKYTLKVPNGLAFSVFKGYDGWQTVAVSHNGDNLAVILGNPAMIEAFKSGIPGNGKPFPDGAKMAKIHWTATKRDACSPVSRFEGWPVPCTTSISW